MQSVLSEDDRHPHPKRSFERMAAESRLVEKSAFSDLPARVHADDRGKLLTLLELAYQAGQTQTEIPSGQPVADFFVPPQHQVLCVEASQRLPDGAGPAAAPLLYEVTVTYAPNTVLPADTLFDSLRQVDPLRVTNLIVTSNYAERRLVLQLHLRSSYWQAPRRETQRLITTIFFATEDAAVATATAAAAAGALDGRRYLKAPRRETDTSASASITDRVRSVLGGLL